MNIAELRRALSCNQETLRQLPLRVVVVRYSSLGDVLFDTYKVHALKRHFPQWRITWLLCDPYQELVSSQPYVDEVIVWRRREGMSGFLRLIRQLRKGGYDLFFGLQSSDRCALMAALSGIPLRLGFHPRFQFLYDQDIYWWLGVQEIALVPGGERSFFPGEEARREAGQLLEGRQSGKPLLFAPIGASVASKCWPEEQWRTLVHALGAKGWEVALVGDGPEEIRKANYIAGDAPGRVYNLVGRLSLPLLAAVAERCDAALGGDTGPTHLAVASGLPVVGLFGPTVLAEGYMRSFARILRTDCPQSGCWDAGNCTRVCLASISPASVEETLEEVRKRHAGFTAPTRA